jgi:hypothetical protein
MKRTITIPTLSIDSQSNQVVRDNTNNQIQSEIKGLVTQAAIGFGKYYGLSALISTGIVSVNARTQGIGLPTPIIDNYGNGGVSGVGGSGLESVFSPDVNNPGIFWNGKTSTSLQSMPVMCSLTFIGTSYTALDGSIVTIPTIVLETVIITAKQGKTIEKTNITGRNTGSVKEYISQNDWSVEIRAVITASANVVQDGSMINYIQEGRYPIENMQYIYQLINAPIAIKVDCLYLNAMGINFLVIDDGVQINQVEGEYEMQRIVLPCLSDNPLIISVNTPNVTT